MAKVKRDDLKVTTRFECAWPWVMDGMKGLSWLRLSESLRD